MIGGVLGFGRAIAETRMLDTCRITRDEDSDNLDEDSGTRAKTTVLVFDGKCRVKHSGMAPKDVEAQSQLLATVSTEIHIPLGAVDVRSGDIVTIASSQTRPDQIGRKYKVSAPFDGSQTTAVRLRVEAFYGR